MFQRKPTRFRHRSNGRSPGRHSHGHTQRPNTFSNGHSRNGFRPAQSPAKLLEKYNALAKEALSSGDRILSENYLQHVDHFERIISSKNLNQNENKSQETNPTKVENSNPSNSDQTEQAQKIEK
jgi:hypothetical protein|tara:strand:- start:1289 stop:1660 length:372 start_codon:yes stop_codon:yes gene_type:complete